MVKGEVCVTYDLSAGAPSCICIMKTRYYINRLYKHVMYNVSH